MTTVNFARWTERIEHYTAFGKVVEAVDAAGLPAADDIGVGHLRWLCDPAIPWHGNAQSSANSLASIASGRHRTTLVFSVGSQLSAPSLYATLGNFDHELQTFRHRFMHAKAAATVAKEQRPLSKEQRERLSALQVRTGARKLASCPRCALANERHPRILQDLYMHCDNVLLETSE